MPIANRPRQKRRKGPDPWEYFSVSSNGAYSCDLCDEFARGYFNPSRATMHLEECHLEDIRALEGTRRPILPSRHVSEGLAGKESNERSARYIDHVHRRPREDEDALLMRESCSTDKHDMADSSSIHRECDSDPESLPEEDAVFPTSKSPIPQLEHQKSRRSSISSNRRAAAQYFIELPRRRVVDQFYARLIEFLLAHGCRIDKFDRTSLSILSAIVSMVRPGLSRPPYSLTPEMIVESIEKISLSLPKDISSILVESASPLVLMVDVWPSKISSVSLLVLSVYRNGADAIPWRSATFTSDSYVESMPELVEKGLLDLPLERVIGVISDDRQVCRDARRQAMERVKELRAQSSSPSMEDARFNHVYETHDFRFHISELLIELTETLEKADGSGSRSGHFCELRREFDRLATLIQDLNKQKIDVPVQYLSVAEKLSEPATVQISRQLRFLALNWPGIAKFLKETKLYASERLTPSLRLSIKQTLKFFRDPEAKQQVQKAAINLAPLQSLIDTHIPNSSAMEAAAAISGVYDNLMGKELLHAEASLADISDRFRQCIGTYELAAMFVPVKRPSDLDSQNCAIKKALNIIGRSGSFGFTSSEVSSTIIHYFRHTGPFATVPTRCISADNYWSLFINDGEVSGDFSDGAKSLCHYLYAAATIPASMHPTDATLGADKRNWILDGHQQDYDPVHNAALRWRVRSRHSSCSADEDFDPGDWNRPLPFHCSCYTSWGKLPARDMSTQRVTDGCIQDMLSGSSPLTQQAVDFSRGTTTEQKAQTNNHDSGVSIEDRGCDDNFVCDESMQAGINKSDDTVDPIIAINDLSRHITHEYLMSDPQGVACEHSVGGQWFGGHLLLNTNLRSQTKKRYRVLYTEGTQISRDYTISQVKSMHQAGELKILFLPAHVRSMELLRSAAGG